MSCLHLVALAPTASGSIQSLQALLTSDDVVVLMGEGLSLAGKLEAHEANIYCWSNNYDINSNAVKQIDGEGVVELAIRCDKSMTWLT